MPYCSLELLPMPTLVPAMAPLPAPMAAPRPPPMAAPSPAPSTVPMAAAPTARLFAFCACPATELSAYCLQPAWSKVKASKDLPGPGMTCTVGPIGVWAQPDRTRPSTTTLETPAPAQPRCLTCVSLHSFPYSISDRKGLCSRHASNCSDVDHAPLLSLGFRSG